MEVAAPGRVDGRGEVPRHGAPHPAQVRVQDRGGFEQRLGVGVEVLGHQFGLGRVLHDPPQVHDQDPVRDELHHRQVVGDEDIGVAVGLLQVQQQVDDLGLDGDVQGRHRLVADDQLRVQGQCPGDADALALAAGELVGVAVAVAQVQPHLGHQGVHPLAALGLVADGVDHQGLLDDGRRAAARVEGGEGVLEDHLHPAPGGLQGGPPQAEQVDPVQHRAARGGLFQPEQGLAQGGLAAARLAHHAQGLAPGQVERHPVHGLQDPAPLEVEMLGHLAHFQQCVHRAPHRSAAAGASAKPGQAGH